MIKLKVCGITTLQDAQEAVSCGATYLGFNFYPKSPRYIAPADARLIIERLPKEIVTVGVFVNEPRPENVLDLLQTAGAVMAQLHGDEDRYYCERVGAERVIKAVRTDNDIAWRSIEGFPAWAILLDGFDPKLYGGTGKTADWEIARQAARYARVILAGGLSPDNIAQAIRSVQPFAVDVNSGVESSPGRKDPTKLRRVREEMEKI
ncbi:MAG: phosphoribosylanthranilate isomerase [Blastocatellia bacterium]|nr:phosphoribosylanthranilate isomerase [Blastocatellia bacterium]